MSQNTPMMAQYQAIKLANPDCFVFYRLGDFYELFGDDAKDASRLLNITLTSRAYGEGRINKIPMAGVPYHAAPTYIQKLLRAGKKVAICEQMEDSRQSKGVLRRELVRILTPGTILEDAYLDATSNNFIASLVLGSDQWALAYADNGTGEFSVSEFDPNQSTLDAELQRLRPTELLLSETVPAGFEGGIDIGDAIVSRWDDFAFQADEATRQLSEHFGVRTLEGFGLVDRSFAAQAAGALLAYLKRTQRSPLAHFTKLTSQSGSPFMRLDAATARHLELVTNQEDGSRRNTILALIDESSTAAGARALRSWISAPLATLEPINARLEAVAELHSNDTKREALRHGLSQTADLERALGRISCLSAGPRDLAIVRQTLRMAPVIESLLSDCVAVLLKKSLDSDLNALRTLLDEALVEDPPSLLRDGGFIRPGWRAEFDLIAADSAGAREEILAIQEIERERSGNHKLRIQFNNIFGYFIEVSKAQSSAVPADWDRKQTLVNAERFTTPSLKLIEQRVLGADEKRKSLELSLYEELRIHVTKDASQLLVLAGRIAEVDALASLAQCARSRDWVRPIVDSGTLLQIEGGRHPVVEDILRNQRGEVFSPNDTLLNTTDQRLILITGPNMAGKSTYMRQVAVIALLAQTGSFVPARQAHIGLIDRVFTRVGANDRLTRGLSTFLVEMTETANILNNASHSSLVVLDEIGRGTSTYDGISIAWAVAENLLSTVKCRTLFATHYFELAELEKQIAGAKNFSVSVREKDGKIVFLHELRMGASEHSYGVAVAKLAGVPESVLKRARAVLKGLESKGSRLNTPEPTETTPQTDLFDFEGNPELAGLLHELEALKLDELSPKKAWEFLSDWRERVNKTRNVR